MHAFAHVMSTGVSSTGGSPEAALPAAPPSPPWRLSEAEAIALAYYRAAGQDGWAALVAAVGDALADLAEAERHGRQRDRLVSHGYVRAAPDRGPNPACVSGHAG